MARQLIIEGVSVAARMSSAHQMGDPGEPSVAERAALEANQRGGR